jgi:hypothetical protein
MSYRRVGGGTWDSSQILLRAPGAEPRLIGAVTNRKTGEVVAMPPGGYYGTNSAELWTRNFEQAIAKRPSRREMMARAIARLLDNDYR